MTTQESFERLIEGLCCAASCCRELGVMTKIGAWGGLSKQLLITANKSKEMYKEKPLSEFQVLKLVTEIEDAQKLASMMR